MVTQAQWLSSIIIHVYCFLIVISNGITIYAAAQLSLRRVPLPVMSSISYADNYLQAIANQVYIAIKGLSYGPHCALYVKLKKSFVIVIPSYNNKSYYMKNLQSVFDQDYGDYRVIYIDDCSLDGTAQLVKKHIADRNQHHHVLLIENKKRSGAMANHYTAAHLCNSWEIIVHLDGDDWFAHNHVLSYLNTVYADPAVWLTYGQYRVWPNSKIPSCCHPLPQWVIDKHAYRDYPLVTSHLRTFYASLFKKIKLEDLLYKGQFLAASCDIGFMLPMLEMAHKHAKYIDQVLYIYNGGNPLNDYKVNQALLDLMAYVIRERSPYERLVQLS
jgi:glycosyltransferase involved in cell wall biosynthesis